MAKVRNPFSRARAKRWFRRSFRFHVIVGYDGKFTYRVRPIKPGVVFILCTRYRSFVFSDDPEFHL